MKGGVLDLLESLDEDLLEDILTRLPIKCIFRFKCVARRYDRLISDPGFALRYTKSRPPLEYVLMICRGTDGVPDSRLIQFEMVGAHMMYQIHRSTISSLLRDHHLYVYHESRGLLLCCRQDPGQDMEYYYVCNPTTSQWVALPAPPLGRFCTIRLFNVVDGQSFKVIRAGRWSQSNKDYTQWEHDIFSSETGVWTKVRLRRPNSLSYHPPQPISSDGVVVHYPLDSFDPQQDFTVYNHVENKTVCCSLELPFAFPDMDCPPDPCLGITGGLLQCSYSFPPWLKVWVLRGDGKWYLKHKAKFEVIVRQNPQVFDDPEVFSELAVKHIPYIVPMIFHRTDPHVVVLKLLPGLIAAYHMDTGILDMGLEVFDMGLEVFPGGPRRMRSATVFDVVQCVHSAWPAPIPPVRNAHLMRFQV